jgi:hypothetical protein
MLMKSQRENSIQMATGRRIVTGEVLRQRVLEIALTNRRWRHSILESDWEQARREVSDWASRL